MPCRRSQLRVPSISSGSALLSLQRFAQRPQKRPSLSPVVALRQLSDRVHTTHCSTLYYVAGGKVQKPFSIRMSTRTMARLDAGARRRGEPKSRVAERLIDEGLRMEDHPGIVFRDGPTGRRAALAGGPDVWEVIETVRDSGLTGEQAIAAAAEWGNISPAQVRVAVGYYADFREEIDVRIARNAEELDLQRATWIGAQEALA